MASRQRIKPEPYLLPVAADSRKYLVRLVQNQFDVREEEILAELSECAFCLLYVLVCATNAITSTHQHCRKVSKVNGALWPQSCKEGTKKASTHLTKLHQQLREEWLQDEDNNTYSELKAACEGAKKARLPYDGKLDSSLWPADWVSDPHWCICTLYNSHCAPTNVHRPRRRQSCHRRRWWP
jgi:hypothetical protein